MSDPYNLNDFHRLFRRTERTKGVTTSLVRISLDRIKSRKIMKLTHVTVENKTSAYTKCRLAISHYSGIHYLDELETIAQNELAVSRSDILLGEGDIFFAELTGTTTGDELIMTCIGSELDL